MTKQLPRTLWALITLLALLAVAGAGGAAPAAAAARPAGVVVISSTASGFTATDQVTPGVVTFTSTTTDANSGWVGLVKLNSGVGWDQFLATFRKVVSTDAASIVAGSKELAGSARLLGGAVIRPGSGASFTQAVEPGSYVLFDYRYVQDGTQARHRSLTVTGGEQGAEPAPSATLTLTTQGGAPRIALAGTVRAGQPLRVTNSVAGQPNEAVTFPLPAGVGDAELHAYFAKFSDSGAWPQDPAPFDTTAGLGSLPLSSGMSSVLTLPLTPGRYVVANWLKSAADGRSLIKQGQYKIIEVK